jgi:hypothetical protein
MHARCSVASLLGIVVVISQARVPQQITLGMADQKTGRRDLTGRAVIFARVRESTHVLEGCVSAIEGVKPQFRAARRAWARRAQAQSQQDHRHPSARFRTDVIHETDLLEPLILDHR